MVRVNAQGNGTTPTSNGTATNPPSLSPLLQSPTIGSPLSPISAPTPTVAAPVSSKSCYSNITEVNALVKQSNPNIENTYVLCPDTVYPIGKLLSTGVLEGGFETLRLRANSKFLCGADGASANNCTLIGGEFHILSAGTDFPDENFVNVVIQGLTFDDSGTGGVLLAFPGDVTFIDCIFQVRFTLVHLEIRRPSNLFLIDCECLHVFCFHV
jgi:hypothetical protein